MLATRGDAIAEAPRVPFRGARGLRDVRPPCPAGAEPGAARPVILTDYEQLVAAMKARAEALMVSNAALDELAGLAAGYTGKVLGGSRTKRFGWLSIFCMAPALGLRLALVEDAEALATARARIQPKNSKQVRADNFARGPSERIIYRVLRHLAKPEGRPARAAHRRLLAIAAARLMQEPNRHLRRPCSGSRAPARDVPETAKGA